MRATRACLAVAALSTLAWANPAPAASRVPQPVPLARVLRRDPILSPLADHVRCIDGVVAQFHLEPRRLFLAVIRTEGGWPGVAHRNTNGTWDYGPGQINSIWISRLRRRGIPANAWLLRNDICFNLYASAWILHHEIHWAPNLWIGLVRYHSHTPALQRRYLRRVLANWARLSRLTRPPKS